MSHKGHNTQTFSKIYIMTYPPYPSFLTHLSLFLYPDKIWFLLRPPPTFLINVIKYPGFFYGRLPLAYIRD